MYDRVIQARLRGKSALRLNQLVAENGLEDVAEYLRKRDVEYTHFQGKSHARLDRAYISSELVPMCTNCSVEPVSFSDRCVVTLTLGNKRRVPKWNWNFWKLKSSLLEDEAFVTRFNDLFQGVNADKQMSRGVLWDLFKEQVKISAVERSTIINKEKRKSEKELRNQLQALIVEESKNLGEFKLEIRDTKIILEAMDAERYRGAIMRSRADKMWSGETPTKRTLGDEKRYAQRNEIVGISFRAATVSDNETIKCAFVDYNSTLLGKNVSMDHGLKSEFLSLMPKLHEQVRESLESPISIKEIEKAIHELSSSKTPGPDGLSAEFYRAFKVAMASF